MLSNFPRHVCKIFLSILLCLCPGLVKAADKEGKPMKTEKIILAGGCFWCTESVFNGVSGVIDAVAGYTGGQKKNPTYEQVSSGKTGHYEAVEVTFDPEQITLEDVLNVYWRDIDPTDEKGQFADKGAQYRTAIFYFTDKQKEIALESRDKLDKSGMFKKPVVTQVLKAAEFYPAEEYHQDYSVKESKKYKKYRAGSGREAFLEKTWNNAPNLCPLPRKVSLKKYKQSDLQKKLTPIQFAVTQENSTEPAFRNKYWNNHREGIYVDVVSGEPLFSSQDKYDSGTGWPSFSKPLDPASIVEIDDTSHGMVRTEVRSKDGDSHLGHVFDGERSSPTGQRYCMNSAALRFIPKEDLEKEGYGQYKPLFEK